MNSTEGASLKTDQKKGVLATKRNEQYNTTVKTMKIAMAIACVYIVLNITISQSLYERFSFKPNISTINNLFLTLENGSREFQRTAAADDNSYPSANLTESFSDNFDTVLQDLKRYSIKADPSLKNVRENHPDKLSKDSVADAHGLKKMRVSNEASGLPFQYNPEIQKHYAKVKGERVYIYSAIVSVNNSFRISAEKGKSGSDFITLNGWRNNASDPDLKCCYMLHNYKVISSSQFLEPFVHPYNTILKAVQYRCPVIYHGFKKIIGVGLARTNSLCPTEPGHYLSPALITRNDTMSIGICSKISYGSMKIGPLVEWFEAMKLFGVDKIFSYNSNLSLETRKVFDHYRSIGLLEDFPFDIPEKDLYPREMGEKSFQAWADEQVVIFDCQERLGAFKYAVFIDKDEFLLPKKIQFKNALKIYFSRLSDNVAAQRFLSVIHLTDWPASNPAHPLLIGKYGVKSKAVVNTVKYMFKPTHVQPGKCIAHSLRLYNGANAPLADNKKITLHHFRSCQTDRRFFVNGTFCRETRRSPSRKIGNLADALKDTVLDTLKKIRNSF